MGFTVGQRVRSEKGVEGTIAGPHNSNDNNQLKVAQNESVVLEWVFTDDGEVRRFRADKLAPVDE